MSRVSKADFICREARPGDADEYLRMRELLWPGSKDEHRDEIDAYFRGESRDVVVNFVLDRGDERAPGPRLGGFLELNVRNYAEGSSQPRVPYVEGWFVDDDLRRRGAGRRLMEAAEGWAREHGFHELASDAELDNDVSIAAHGALGFEEVERVVCFLKRLAPTK